MFDVQAFISFFLSDIYFLKILFLVSCFLFPYCKLYLNNYLILLHIKILLWGKVFFLSFFQRGKNFITLLQ